MRSQVPDRELLIDGQSFTPAGRVRMGGYWPSGEDVEETPENPRRFWIDVPGVAEIPREIQYGNVVFKQLERPTEADLEHDIPPTAFVCG
jgi:hypothetical protein